MCTYPVHTHLYEMMTVLMKMVMMVTIHRL